MRATAEASVYRIEVELVSNRSDGSVVIKGIIKDEVTKCALAYAKLL
jgi:hypothetical protein